MDFEQELDRLMEQANHIALATAIANRPNVRIVNFYYDAKQKGMLYISTFRGRHKIDEFAENDNVAFTTIPIDTSQQHVRVVNGKIRRSDLSIRDVQAGFAHKQPGYGSVIDQMGDAILLYEIHFTEATVTMGVGKVGTVSI